MEELESLEVAYYSQGVPASLGALTLLALVFDRVHFPAIHLPGPDFDEEALKAEYDRLMKIGPRRNHDWELLNYMGFALERKHLNDFCVFSGVPEIGGGQEPETHEIAVELERLIYGPPREDFIPAWSSGHAKELPDGNCICYPGWINYPANALVYAAKHGLPFINDDPDLPVPSLGSQEHRKNNARILSIIMAIECVKLTLPRVPVLMPAQLAEFREQVRPHVRPFRRGMLEAAKELNAAIESGASDEDVQIAAEFIAKTHVVPRIEELRDALSHAAPSWKKTVAEMGVAIGSLVPTFANIDPRAGTSFGLAALAGVMLKREVTTQMKRADLRRSPHYYLLRLEEAPGSP
jgi:hypothetical protein